MTDFTYAPGRFVAVCSGATIAMLDRSVEHPLVTLVWDAAAAGSDLDDLLEILISEGLRAVPAFALARRDDDGGVRVVVRGALAVTVDDSQPVTGQGLWTDQRLHGDRLAVATLDADPEDAAWLPLQGGVVAASGVRWVAQAGPSPVEADSEPVDASPDADEPVADEPVVDEPASDAPAFDEPADQAEPDPDADFWSRNLVSAQDAPTTVLPSGSSRPALGLLRLADGGAVLLDRAAILGRNPSLPQGYAYGQAQLVRLHDPDRDVSSQHLEVLLDDGAVYVRDLGSPNGTEIAAPGRHPVIVPAHHLTKIEPGTRIILAGVYEIGFEE